MPHCILYFERSRNQRPGFELFLGKWNSRGGFPSPSSPMAFLLWHLWDSNSPPLLYESARLTTTPHNRITAEPQNRRTAPSGHCSTWIVSRNVLICDSAQKIERDYVTLNVFKPDTNQNTKLRGMAEMRLCNSYWGEGHRIYRLPVSTNLRPLHLACLKGSKKSVSSAWRTYLSTFLWNIRYEVCYGFSACQLTSR